MLRSPPASATFAAGDNVEISGGGVRWRTVWRWPAGGEFTVTVGAQLSDCGAHPQIAVGSLHNVGHQTVRQSAVHVPGIHLVISLDLGAAERSVGGPPAPELRCGSTATISVGNAWRGCHFIAIADHVGTRNMDLRLSIRLNYGSRRVCSKSANQCSVALRYCPWPQTHRPSRIRVMA